ncbi:MAG: hypothetical protein AB7S96_04305, partial [Candidatus Izemoplasmatales bacterium]
CNSNKEEYIGVLKQDIEVCVDDCKTDYDTYSLNVNTYMDYNNTWLEQFNGDLGENHNIIPNGVKINKDDIAREDPISFSYQLMISMPYKRIEETISFIGEIVRSCEVDGVCDAPLDNLFSNLTEMDFGFDENTGYSRITNFKDGKKEIKYYTFNLDDNDIQYEIFRYNEDSGYLFYSYFYDGVLKEYCFKSNTDFDYYYYFNSDTRESFALYKTGEILSYQMFDPDKNVYYENNKSEKYQVNIYDGFYNMTGLTFDEDVYTYDVSMFYMNGWDYLSKDVLDGYPNNKVYNGETEVFSNYDIEVRTYDLKYVEVFGKLEMSASEWNDFEIPTEFTGSIVKSDLTDKLDYLMDLKNPYDLIKVTDEDILEQYSKILNLLDTKYK